MTVSVNPLGCSPRALQALNSMSTADVSTYPDQKRLLSSLAVRYDMRPDMILLGIGSEQLIKLVCQTFLKRQDTAFVESGSFFLFSREPKILGARVVFFDFNNAKRFRKRPTLLFLANPTTPAGINRTNEEILQVIDLVNPMIAVVDEANGEFRNGSLISDIRKRRNLVVLRTFSKTLGLAGLRIGMAFGNSDVISRMGELQQPFPVTSAALAAAEAALDDISFTRKTIRFVKAERAFLTKELITRGFSVSPSVTNNLFISGKNIKKVICELENRGVSVIDGAYFPGNTQPGFRISLRDRRTNRKFLSKVDEVLACMGQNKLIGSKEIL